MGITDFNYDYLNNHLNKASNEQKPVFFTIQL